MALYKWFYLLIYLFTYLLENIYVIGHRTKEKPRYKTKQRQKIETSNTRTK